MKTRKPPLELATEFFAAHAQYYYHPGKETIEQGRMRCARELAEAERDGKSRGLEFEWSQDDCDSSEWSEETPPWPQFACLCRSESGEVLASLGGIDFGRDGSPGSDPYKRVIEAELALEALPMLEPEDTDTPSLLDVAKGTRDFLERVLDNKPDEAIDLLSNSGVEALTDLHNAIARAEKLGTATA